MTDSIGLRTLVVSQKQLFVYLLYLDCEACFFLPDGDFDDEDIL